MVGMRAGVAGDGPYLRIVVLSHQHRSLRSSRQNTAPQARTSKMRLAGRSHAAWLAGTSVLTLALMGGLSGATARPLFGGANASAAVTSAVNAAMASVQQAQQATVQSRNSLSAAVRAIQAMQATQAAAHSAAAAAGGSVPNGLAPGGAAGRAQRGRSCGVAGCEPAITVEQQWPDYGHRGPEYAEGDPDLVELQCRRHTLLYFNQSAGTQSNGNNNWVALNRLSIPPAYRARSWAGSKPKAQSI